MSENITRTYFISIIICIMKDIVDITGKVLLTEKEILKCTWESEEYDEDFDPTFIASN